MNTILLLLLLQAGCAPVGMGLSGTMVIPDAGVTFHVWVCPGMNPMPEPEAIPGEKENPAPEPSPTPRRERTL